MRRLREAVSLVALSLLVTTSGQGQAQAKPGQAPPRPGSRPSYATAQCADSTYWTNTDRHGACTGHGGVFQWYPLSPPKDAIARCGDDTWSAGPPATACAQHGGVRLWLRPPNRASNVTALCSDRTEWTGTNQSTACLGHGGVSEWFGGPGGSMPTKTP